MNPFQSTDAPFSLLFRQLIPDREREREILPPLSILTPSPSLPPSLPSTTCRVDLNWPPKKKEWSIQARPSKEASKSATVVASNLIVKAAIGSDTSTIEAPSSTSADLVSKDNIEIVKGNRHCSLLLQHPTSITLTSFKTTSEVVDIVPLAAASSAKAATASIIVDIETSDDESDTNLSHEAMCRFSMTLDLNSSFSSLSSEVGSDISTIEAAASGSSISKALSVTTVEAATFTDFTTTVSVIVDVEPPAFATIIPDEDTARFHSSMLMALSLASPTPLAIETVVDDDDEEDKQQQQQQLNAHLDANDTYSDDRALQLYLPNIATNTTDINDYCNVVPPPPRHSTPPVEELLVLGTYTFYGTFVSGNPALDTLYPQEIAVLVLVDTGRFPNQTTTHSIIEITEEEEAIDVVEQQVEEEEEVTMEEEEQQEEVVVVEEKKKEEAMMLPLWTLFQPNAVALAMANFGHTSLAYEEQNLPLWFMFSDHNLTHTTDFFSSAHVNEEEDEMPCWMLFQQEKSPWKLASGHFGYSSVEFEDRELPLYWLLEASTTVNYLLTCWHFTPAKTEAEWLIFNGVEEEVKVDEPTWGARMTRTLGTFMKRVTRALVKFSKRASSWFFTKNPVTHHFL